MKFLNIDCIFSLCYTGKGFVKTNNELDVCSWLVPCTNQEWARRKKLLLNSSSFTIKILIYNEMKSWREEWINNFYHRFNSSDRTKGFNLYCERCNKLISQVTEETFHF